MVIITSEELADDFEQVADYRTQQGIITVIRTLEWIDQFYSGCDTPERIRNFIRDAHDQWGIQAVLLGGDDGIVPVRECWGWRYTNPPSHYFQFPSDDYYADIDGSWSNNSWQQWLPNEFENYLDLCAGRWPVDDGDDVDLMFTKLKLYEWPDCFPEDFARKLLLLGSNGNLTCATKMIELVSLLEESGAIPEYLDNPTELYYPHSLPGGDLQRNSALAAFDQGYNLIIHGDHSGVHEIGTAAQDPLWQVMWDSDFATMSNSNEPSILWTLGCDPGYFDGADCFAEAGLLTSSNSGLVAVIANSRAGHGDQYRTCYAFCDALFNTGYIDFGGYLPVHWPLSYIGEAHRCSKNHDNSSPLNPILNLLGSPLMYIWCDDPGVLYLSVPLIVLREGVPQDITVTVTDGIDPVVNALTYPGIESNEVAELSGQIELTVTASLNPDWFDEFDGCSFDVVVTSDGGEFIARHVDVGQVYDLQHLTLSSPYGLQAYEAGQDYISLVWDHNGSVAAEGFYVYYDDGTEQYRAYPLPVPVEQATIEGLLPGSEYDIEVTAIDAIGRESTPATAAISTTCPAVAGWPIQLSGSPGGGAAIADIDQDGSDEIIVATSFGLVYIIERDGNCYTLGPPSGYDFDRFLGCAVGDVDGDSQLEIVISCQKKIEVEDEEQVAILLFDKNGMIWNVSEIATTNVNEEVSSPYIGGTPVLFQADGVGRMEIALRTNPHLYVWRYDQNSGSWVDYSNDFPVILTGDFWNSPTAVDFDEDGYEELIVTTYGSGGVGTALVIVNFESNGEVSIKSHGLPELDKDGTARVYGTLAGAEENGEYYITGVARRDSSNKRIFVYLLDADTGGVTHIWQTSWMNGIDAWSNMPGPAIGDLDGNNDLEVICTLKGGYSDEEGVVYAWDLGDGSQEFQSCNIPFNPIIGGGVHIKSQPVIGLTTSPGSGKMAIFSGFSSLCCGHDPQDGSSMLEGFPSWTRDGAWAAPSICDLDSDGYAEILYIDYSGFATLFDWDEGFYTSDGWHMYQDNPLRNGFYNTIPGKSNGLDISISGSPYIAAEENNDSRGLCLIAEVEITGTSYLPVVGQIPAIMSDIVADIDQVDFASIPAEGFITENVDVSGTLTRDNRGDCSCISENATLVLQCRTVEVTVFYGDRPVGSGIVQLEEGTHKVEIPLRSGFSLEGDITVVADPFNEYFEIDETNNVSSAENISIASNVTRVFIPNPAEAIELSVDLPSNLPEGIKIRVYSIDGRLVTSIETEELHSGSTNLLISDVDGTDRLPAGMYTVCIEGLGGEIVRKVIILGH